MSQTTLQELEARGLVEQVTHRDELEALLEAGPVAIYCGFDPTASSLHVGNLLPVMMLAHLQRRGHRPIALVGGATGMIGDPSGRDTERQLLDLDTLANNLAGIRQQLSSFLDFEGDAAATIVNNHDWISPISFLEWLRDVGKYFTLNQMMAKESVKRRLDNREQGITYTEFSYQMLQSYDFRHLRENYNCKVQVGGNDQWGNITAGCDYTHKTLGERVYGITCPLLTTASGDKFGKSAGNAVWLDAEQTSPYEFYQYWIQADDRDVISWLRIFTFVPFEEIEAIEAEHAKDPGQRFAQRRLAEETTRLIHGEDGLKSALAATSILFGGAVQGLSDRELQSIFKDVPAAHFSRAELAGEGLPLLDLLARTLCKSKGEARRLVQQGGASLNNDRVDDLERVITLDDLATESALLLRSGKKKYFVAWFDQD